MKLTDAEKQAIAQGETIRTTTDGIQVAVLRIDVFENISSALSPKAVSALIEETMSEYDQGDPLLESYQNLKT